LGILTIGDFKNTFGDIHLGMKKNTFGDAKKYNWGFKK
jgi:hypothetical protein